MTCDSLALSACLLGIVFAEPLRYSFVVRDPLRFPTCRAMAVVIGLLDERPDFSEIIIQDQSEFHDIHGKKILGSILSTEDDHYEAWSYSGQRDR